MSNSKNELISRWRTVVSNLEQDPDLSSHQKGFLSLAVPKALVDNALILLAVREEHTRRTIETRLLGPLTREFSKVLGFDVTFGFVVDPELDVPIRFEDLIGEPTPGTQVPVDPVTSTSTTGTPEPAPAEAAEPVRPTPADQSTPQIPQPNQGQPGQGRPAAQTPSTQMPQAETSAPPARQMPAQQLPQDPAESGMTDREMKIAEATAAPMGPPVDAPGVAQLNPKYTFDTFVIGASNRFAHAAAFAVAEAPAKAYNPLFIYGDSGLGKTHLLHAIGYYATQLFPEIRVKYVSSEEFVNDFINTIGSSKTSNALRPAFQRRYREVDILMIDDIQFLQGKDATVEEFFHTFNALHNEAKQVVITSDQPPKMLKGFEERLRSRFEWGLLTDVQPPDMETRFAILRRKAAAEHLDVPDDVLEYIASRVSSNIRELEGALIRVTAFANLNDQQIDVSLAETVLKDFITPDDTPAVSAADIMGQTAAYFSLTLDDLCGTSRSRTLTTARQIAMYLCRELTDLSLPKIGQAFGGRDHTTVMHANKKIRTQMAERRAVYTQVTELTNRIKQQHRL
ncbi:chromosomal replication initiator protein DnaA [Brevibacterium linens]|uniref:Chromosomal replication initiator protein DnaA n=2 Tax=Brevibacterium linens TaxID=1703 RepID=A0A2H1I4A7_BRELN|nr:chromosomal replication initiator protein DnaA [Brevibacterium linens]AZU02541.1 chromosomal replication initiator protein DnaA [Brevibacterium linens]KAB1948064.1 chromosomal replication initiator protein DnaA [Brevibacterium linens ATCC 9172]SMX70028.1 chromosomal replication initiator protein [Brevibacterium linens]SMX83695.1 chromosomal replication initiator protein [Brevibacterium linens ATCC 9172]